MVFENYNTLPHCDISPSILWEYDTTSQSWDWNKMATRVVERVLLYGLESDYVAMLQLYGGFENVGNIVKKIPHLPKREANWARFLFHLNREDMSCYTRKSLRERHINS